MLTVNIPLRLTVVFIASIWMFTNAETLSIHTDMNKYYEKMDESFSRLARSSAFKSTSLNGAERLFVKELRKNLAYYVLSRTNSKGKVISEAVRGKKVERPNTDVETEKWFQEVKKSKEPYFSLTRDDDRGRYYLIWSKPVIKNNNFIGAITAKIDLWDSFYEFSNSVYYPFLIRLNSMSLFSHKWNNDFSYKEERLTIPGINRISVRFIPEKKVAVSTSLSASSKVASDTITQKADTASVADTAGSIINKESSPKRNPLGIFLIAIIATVAGGAIISIVIISKSRRNAFLKELDDQ